MQNTAPTTSRSLAPVISLDARRAARARTARRRISAQPLVALWFGSAIFATGALLGFATMVALRDPMIGIPIGVAVTTAASWGAAGSWLRSHRTPRTAA